MTTTASGGTPVPPGPGPGPRPRWRRALLRSTAAATMLLLLTGSLLVTLVLATGTRSAAWALPSRAADLWTAHPVRVPLLVLSVLLAIGVTSANLLYQHLQLPRPLPDLVLLLPALLALDTGTAWLLVGRTFWDGQPLLVVVLVTLLLVLLLKVLVLHRYAHRGPGPLTGPRPLLLPERGDDLDALCRHVRDRRSEGRILPLTGRWGEGKSLLVDRLEQALDRRDDPAVVRVDVWQVETEDDLQREIVEALVAHPAFRRHLRWLLVPLQLVLFEVVSSLTLKLPLPVAGAEAGGDLRLPPLNWQRTFEQLVSHLPGGLLVVLDEVDRAHPAAAQAAITVARRGGQVPGVQTLMPYTASLVRYKAFNPLVASLPDLAATMEAMVFERYQHRTAIAADAEQRSSAYWHGLPGGGLAPVLRAHYARLPLDERRWLQRQFEEKYLSSARIVVSPPNAGTAVALLTGDYLPWLRDAARAVMPPDGPARDVLLPLIEDGLRETGRSPVLPPMRSFAGCLSDLLLPLAGLAVPPGALVDEVLIADVVILAVELSATHDPAEARP